MTDWENNYQENCQVFLITLPESFRLAVRGNSKLQLTRPQTPHTISLIPSDILRLGKCVSSSDLTVSLHWMRMGPRKEWYPILIEHWRLKKTHTTFIFSSRLPADTQFQPKHLLHTRQLISILLKMHTWKCYWRRANYYKTGFSASQ